jgi:hypothetical protein
MKNQFKLIFLLISVSLVFITACSFDSTITGSDNTVQEELSITDFNAIDLSHSFNAEIIQSDQYKVVVKYNSNLKEYIEVLKDGKALKIGLKDGHIYLDVKLSVKIYMPDITAINSSGACKITIAKFKAGNLKIDLSGASDLHADLEIDNNLKINSSGASCVFIAGNAKNADFDFSGASKLSGKGLIISDNLFIEGSGASTISITADGKISLNLSGASTINYYGKGSIVKSDISGASSIRKKENDTL